MASGIYKLTFASGKFYVGKSIDLESRWLQHANKFTLGTAAKSMQAEYNRCGMPDASVILYCHRDHIDLMEEWFIDQLYDADMLNTSKPKVERTPEIAALITHNLELLTSGTWQHLQLINELQEKSSTLEDYRSRGYVIDEDYVAATTLAEERWHEAEELREELERLKNLSWWERIFDYKVYV
jgi:hypothetical protein